jgi:hypothetical protein
MFFHVAVDILSMLQYIFFVCYSRFFFVVAVIFFWCCSLCLSALHWILFRRYSWAKPDTEYKAGREAGCQRERGARSCMLFSQPVSSSVQAAWVWDQAWGCYCWLISLLCLRSTVLFRGCQGGGQIGSRALRCVKSVASATWENSRCGHAGRPDAPLAPNVRASDVPWYWYSLTVATALIGFRPMYTCNKIR